MKILGVIPARYESSRFPGKPLVDICGKPMIWWVYNQVEKVNKIDEVYVATDDKRIEKACLSYNMNVIMTSKEHKTGTDRVAEVAQLIEADYYINIQGDEPLIEPQNIQKIVDLCGAEGKDFEIVNVMTKIRNKEDIQKSTIVKVIFNENNDLIYLSRLQIPFSKNGESIQYYKHLGLYSLTRNALLFFAKTPRAKIEKIEDIEMLRFLENGYKIKMLEVTSETIAIDVKEDLENVLKIMEKY